MPEIVWYRSLYWRIALGFVALLSALRAVQGLVSLWLTGRAAEFLSGHSPAAYANAIAADLTPALADDPALDLEPYLNGRFKDGPHPFAVAMVAKPAAISLYWPPPPPVIRAAHSRLLATLG